MTRLEFLEQEMRNCKELLVQSLLTSNGRPSANELHRRTVLEARMEELRKTRNRILYGLSVDSASLGLVDARDDQVDALAYMMKRCDLKPRDDLGQAAAERLAEQSFDELEKELG